MKLKSIIPISLAVAAILILFLYAIGVVQFKSPIKKKDFNPVTYVDEQPEILIDWQIFLNRIKPGFKTKSVFENFGDGQHVFLFETFIDKTNSIVDYQLQKQRGNKYIPVNYLLDKEKLDKILETIPVEAAKLKGNKVDYKFMLPLSVIINKEGKVVQDWALHTTVKFEGVGVKKTNDEAFTYVDEMPSFPAGNDKLLAWISKEVHYPQEAKNAGIEGRVMVQFVVEKSGDISEITILRGIGGGCDEEAARVCSVMPKWKPGKQAGKPVRVRMVIPFLFKLQ